MDHDPARPPHPAPREVIFHDAGGWISGPCAETVAAEDVQPGDVLLLDDLTRAEVTDTRLGFYHLPGGRGLGVALGWRSGTSSGLLFRKATDILLRVAGKA